MTGNLTKFTTARAILVILENNLVKMEFIWISKILEYLG